MRVEGGLGNQLFMYCKARDLQIRSGLKVALDASYFRQEKRNTSGPNEEQFWLENYNIKYNKLIASPIFQSRKILSDMFEFYDDTDPEMEKLDERPENLDYHYLRGFWQDEQLFKNNWHIIKDELTIKERVESESLNQIRATEISVGMSVRRGDFLRCDDRPTMSRDFYLHCAYMILERHPNASFFLFSDDDEWVKENIVPAIPRATQIERSICYKDLYILSQCDHHIIPNSTFSWWAAWMCKNPNKIIIGPDRWNNSSGKGNIMPQSWIRVEML